MKNTKQLLVLAVALVTLTSCQKDYYKDDLDDANDKIAQLESKVAGINAELSASIALNATQADELATLQSDITELTNSLVSTEGLNQDLVAQAEALENELNVINAQISALQLELASALDVDTVNLVLIADLNDQIAALEGLEPAIVTEYITIVETIVETVYVTEYVTNVVTEVVTNTVIIDNTDDSTIADLSSQITGLEILLETAREQLVYESQQLTAAYAQITELQSALAEETGRLNETLSFVQQLQFTIALNDENAASELASKTAAYEAVLAEIAILEGELTGSDADLSAAQVAIATYQRYISELHQTAAELTSTIRSLSNAVALQATITYNSETYIANINGVDIDARTVLMDAGSRTYSINDRIAISLGRNSYNGTIVGSGTNVLVRLD